MVFRTAPPHRESNARITWPAVLVGGPEASQKGLGDSMPQNFTRKSAILHLTRIQCAYLASRLPAGPPRKPCNGGKHSDPTQRAERIPYLYIVFENTRMG